MNGEEKYRRERASVTFRFESLFGFRFLSGGLGGRVEFRAEYYNSSALWSGERYGEGMGLARGLLTGLVVRSKDMWMGKPTPSLNECFLVRVLLLSCGLLFIKCRSTHLSMVKTESVEGKRRSAAVLMMLELAIRKVAAMPRSACGISQLVKLSARRKL